MDIIKELLNILYLISGPVLVYIAYTALDQVKFAKAQIDEQKEATRINSLRDALKLTSDQISRYCEYIIPLQDALDEKIASEEVHYLEKSTFTIVGEEINVSPCSEDGEYEKIILILPEFTKFINAIEGFSSYFISGVADEEIAYKSLGSTYINAIQGILPILVLFDTGNSRFSATMQLFLIWHHRFESQDLKKQQEQIKEKLKNNKDMKVNVVGASS